MPREKSKKSRDRPPPARSSSAATNTRYCESSFNEFSSGAPVTSSPPQPSLEIQQLVEYKNSVLGQLEEEKRITEEFIISAFEKLEKDLSRAKETVYNSATLGEKLQLFEAVGKILEDANRCEAVSRKGTWNSNNSENMPPPSEFRRPRRSQSCDARPTHNTMLSHRPRQARSTDRLMKTPLTNYTRPYNVATVTPHPQFSVSKNTMSILRKPNPGEMAISMGGSPLCVNGESNLGPSVTVPLSDGRVFQVLGATSPSSPFQEEMRRGLDDETKKKLEELKKFITKLV